MRRILVIGAVAFSTALLFGVTAWAVGPAGPDDEAPAEGKVPSAAQAPQAEGPGEDTTEVVHEEAGVHGGEIDRFHAPGGCGLVSIGGLPGNWTHGDYVTAVSVLGDPVMVVDAAHSACGKPMQAVSHGVGPPAHALEHAAKAAKAAKGEKVPAVDSEDDEALGS